MADKVCVLILSGDLCAIDIEIEKNKVRERCLELYPDREDSLEMIYVDFSGRIAASRLHNWGAVVDYLNLAPVTKIIASCLTRVLPPTYMPHRKAVWPLGLS